MPAVKTTENRISAEARNKIKQERAKLQQELEHAQENFDVAKAALEEAADPALDSQVYVDAHRDYMQMELKLRKKQAEIDKHRKTFLSDEEISRQRKAAEERERQDVTRKSRGESLTLPAELQPGNA